MTKTTVCHALIVAACLSLIPSWAYAQEKAPRKPRVFPAAQCEETRVKAGPVMVCVTAKRTSVLAEYARVTMPDGSAWIVGR